MGNGGSAKGSGKTLATSPQPDPGNVPLGAGRAGQHGHTHPSPLLAFPKMAGNPQQIAAGVLETGHIKGPQRYFEITSPRMGEAESAAVMLQSESWAGDHPPGVSPLPTSTLTEGTSSAEFAGTSVFADCCLFKFSFK